MYERRTHTILPLATITHTLTRTAHNLLVPQIFFNQLFFLSDTLDLAIVGFFFIQNEQILSENEAAMVHARFAQTLHHLRYFI